MVNVVPYNRVEYTLEHEELGPLVVSEPKGWETDDKEYQRVDDYDGVFTKFSNNLTFYNDGVDYIKMVYTLYGPNTNLICKRRERHPKTNKWIVSYIGYLDLMTYVFENNSVKIKFNSSGLEDQIKSRANEKIEIERRDTLDGTPIPELETIYVNQDGRRIFLRTVFGTSGVQNNPSFEVASNAGNTRSRTLALPIVLDVNQHQDIAQTPYFNALGTNNNSDIGMPFLLNATRLRNFKINLNASWTAFFQQYENVQWCFVKANLTIYENGFDFTPKEGGEITLFELNSGFADNDPRKLPDDVDYPYPQFRKQMSASFNDTITLLEGESLVFELHLRSDMFVDNNAGVRVFVEDFENELIIEEDSFFEASKTKAVLAHELGERITQIITDRDDAFYSEALGRTDIGYAEDGVNTGALNAYAHGQWIRGFDKLPENEDNKYKAFTTTFNEFVNHNEVAWNLGIGIEKIGLFERIRIENKRFFYQNAVTINVGYKENGIWVYPQVSKLKRKPSKKYFYKSLEIGYDKGGDNEEAMGLDEPNTKSTFSTHITKSNNIFTRVSKYITASYAKEFIRRKPKKDFPTTDHQNDKEIFAIDCKRGPTEVYEERKYQDDFAVEPTGIFSPETATNLRLSVFNVLLRHGWEIATTMSKNLFKYIRYSSSEGNSSLVTQLIGGQPYAENGNILGDDLEKARYLPEEVEFEYPFDIEMIEQIEGNTVINGKRVPNFYGLAKYRNEENELETGYIMNLKINGAGKWKLITSNQ